MFSVLNFETKKAILQNSFESKGTVQFRNDVSKADQEVRQKLYSELYRRHNNGENDKITQKIAF
jgi:Skp family chaperone for outer membrane proteins